MELPAPPPPKDSADDNASTSSIGDSAQRYHCDGCEADISCEFRVKCAKCENYDLCVKCFCAGRQSGSHRNSHPYIPVGRNDFPLFSKDWNADEELALVDGVARYGFGNWSEVAALVSAHTSVSPTGQLGPPKRRQECEAHYYQFHVNAGGEKRESGENAPVVPGPEASREAIIAARRLVHRKMVGPFQPDPPVPVLSRSGPPGYNINVVGYMPLRGDLDSEYDQDAELLLADLEFRGDEPTLERELKMKILDIYNSKLHERLRRKRLLIEHGFADLKRLHQVDRRRPKEESDLIHMMRYLARYDDENVDSTKELAMLLLDEKKILDRLQIIREWRSLGLESYEEVAAYEKARAAAAGAEAATPLRPFQLEAPPSEYPGAYLLNDDELELCKSLQLPPLYYVYARQALLDTVDNEKTEPDLKSESGAATAATLAVATPSQSSPVFDFVLTVQNTVPAGTGPVPVPLKKEPARTAPARHGRQSRRYLHSPMQDDDENDDGEAASSDGGRDAT